MKNREAVTIFINSRIMLDATFFRKINPNYTRPQSNKLLRNKTKRNRYFEYYSKSSSEESPNRIKGNNVKSTNIEEKDLFICCSIVSGFSLEDKLWSIIVFLLCYDSCPSNLVNA